MRSLCIGYWGVGHRRNTCNDRRNDDDDDDDNDGDDDDDDGDDVEHRRNTCNDGHNGDDERHVMMKCLSLQFAHASSRLSISMGNQFSTDYSVGPIIMIPTGDHHEILIQLNCKRPDDSSRLCRRRVGYSLVMMRMRRRRRRIMKMTVMNGDLNTSKYWPRRLVCR